MGHTLSVLYASLFALQSFKLLKNKTKKKKPFLGLKVVQNQASGLICSLHLQSNFLKNCPILSLHWIISLIILSLYSPFYKYLLSTYCLLGPIPNAVVLQTDRGSVLMVVGQKISISASKQNNIYIQILISAVKKIKQGTRIGWTWRVGPTLSRVVRENLSEKMHFRYA